MFWPKVLISIPCIVIVILIALLLNFIWEYRFEKVAVSIGEISFDFFIENNKQSLDKVIDYLEGPRSDEDMDSWALVVLENQKFEINSPSGLFEKLKEYLYLLRVGESRKIQLRRLFAKLYAEKLGKIEAAKEEIRDNLKEKNNHKDLIFLGYLLSLKPEKGDQEVIDIFQEASNMKECRNDMGSCLAASVEIHYRKARLLFNREMCDEAIKEYQKVIRIDKHSFRAYAGLADCYGNLRNLTEAYKTYAMAINYSIDEKVTARSHSNIAQILYAQVIEQEKQKGYSREDSLQMLKKALHSISSSNALINEYKTKKIVKSPFDYEPVSQVNKDYETMIQKKITLLEQLNADSHQKTNTK